MADAYPMPPSPDAFNPGIASLTQGGAGQTLQNAVNPAAPQSASPPPQIAALLDKVQKYSQQQQANQQKTQGVDQALLADPAVQKQIAKAFAPEAPRPDIKNYEVENKDSLNAFKDLVPALAIFAGSFSKQPLMNAMSAATGAMEGYNQGRKDLAEQKMQEFKASLDEWKQHHEDLAKAREDIIDKDGNVNYARLAAWASAAGKPQYLSALQTNPPFAAQMFKDEIETTSKLLEVGSTMEKNERVRQNLNGGLKELESVAANVNGEYTDEQVKFALSRISQIKGSERGGYALTDDDYNRLKDTPEVQTAAQSMYEGMKPNQTFPGGYRANAQEIKAAMRLAKEQHPDWDMAGSELQYRALEKAEDKMGRDAQSLAFASRLLTRSIPSLEASAKPLGLSASTDLNTVYNAYKKHLNDPDWKNFTAQMRAVTGDYALLISRGKQTVHSDDEALKILNDNMNLGSIEGFAKAAQQEESNIKSTLVDTQSDISSGSIFGKPNNNSGNVPPPPPGFNVVP